MPQWWRWVPEGTVVATGGRFVKIWGFLLLILAKLCWLTSWKVLAYQLIFGFLLLILTIMSQWWRWVPERTVVATGGCFVKILGFLFLILAKLCWLTNWKALAYQLFLVFLLLILIPMHQWWRWVPEGTVVATGDCFVKILGFLLLILAKLCWLTSWKVLAYQLILGFLLLILIPVPQLWRWVPEGTVVATGGRFVKILGFLLLILAKLCWLTSLKVLASQLILGFLLLILIPMPQWWRWVSEGTVVATSGRFVKILGFLLLILAKLCWLTSWKVLAYQLIFGFFVVNIYNNAPMMALGAWGDSGGYRRPFC